MTAATGVERGDVVKVVDAAFAYLRASLMQGTDVAHPSLGRILVKTRDRDGAPKKVYRYQPELKRQARQGRRSRQRRRLKAAPAGGAGRELGSGASLRPDGFWRGPVLDPDRGIDRLAGRW